MAYIAEKNAEKVAGFFDLEKKDDIIPGGKFKLQEDWGETYKGGNPSIFACSIEEGVVSPVEGVPDWLSPGQVQFSPSGDELVFVGWNNEPRRLGILHCYNRPSAIYSIPFDHQVFKAAKTKTPGEEPKAVEKKAPENRTLCLTKLHRSSRSPRFSPNGIDMVFLASDNAVTHNSSSVLCTLDWATKAEKVIVPLPADDYKLSDSPEKFPGLFTHFLTSNPFLSDSVVALETIWRSKQVLATVNLRSGALQKLSIPSNRTKECFSFSFSQADS